LAEPIHFYFDFSSPFGYIASERIEGIAAELGREVAWHPILLGAVFKETGTKPLVDVPMKGDYSKRDMERSARQHAIAYRLPTAFPFASIAACRAVYWAQDMHPNKVAELVHALYRAAWQDDRDIASPEGVVAVAKECGFDESEVTAALQDSAVKDRLRQAVEESLKAGVFGSPFLVVDGEPFWGNDRLDQMAEWARRGGW